MSVNPALGPGLHTGEPRQDPPGQIPERERPIELEVDGGITPETAGAVVAAGANVLVAGSSIYAGNDPSTYAGRIRALRDAASTQIA